VLLLLAGGAYVARSALGGTTGGRATAGQAEVQAPGWSPGGAATGAGAGIPLGPGPLSPYTVQPQPPAGSCHYRHHGTFPLPDPACTPGARNPKVTTATLATTICRAGYSSSIRPPEAITGREKAANVRSYGYTGPIRTGEYDHLISLELGGDPNDARNLWVEPNDRPGATTTTNGKDAVENAAHAAICAGRPRTGSRSGSAWA
jgi:hypothetical protein